MQRRAQDLRERGAVRVVEERPPALGAPAEADRARRGGREDRPSEWPTKEKERVNFCADKKIFLFS